MKYNPPVHFALFVLALSLSFPAIACSLATPKVYDATHRPADAIIEGEAISDGVQDEGRGQNPFADIRVSDVVLGDFPDQAYRLTWRVFRGDGDCEPPGPWVKPTQSVRIYLQKTESGYRALAWEYPSERPKSHQTMRNENTIAIQRLQRQQANFPMAGALSLDDPEKWLMPSDLPGVEDWKYGVAISFRVTDDGKMFDCKSGHIKEAAKFDLPACKILAEKAKFVPPLFAEETSGYYHWNPYLEKLVKTRASND